MNRMRSNEGSQAALCRGFVATVLLMAGGEASAQVPVDGAYPMQTAPASACRLGDWQIGIGDPFIIASREQDPGDGTFVFPVLRNLNGVLFLNWHHDWDVLDGAMPNKPSGRLSRDGGITWKKQASRMPPGWKVATGPREITSYWNSFEIPGCPGRYRVATWRSADNGLNWDAMSWTEVAYPGTRGLDIYDPPEQYKQHSTNYKLGHQRAAPPPHMEAFFRQAGTRRRGPGLEPVAGADGALVSLVSTRYLPSGQATADEAVYWERLDWKRHAILMQTSDDRGRTWQSRGVVAHDAEHRVADPRGARARAVALGSRVLDGDAEPARVVEDRRQDQQPDVVPGRRRRLGVRPGRIEEVARQEQEDGPRPGSMREHPRHGEDRDHEQQEVEGREQHRPAVRRARRRPTLSQSPIQRSPRAAGFPGRDDSRTAVAARPPQGPIRASDGDFSPQASSRRRGPRPRTTPSARRDRPR